MPVTQRLGVRLAGIRNGAVRLHAPFAANTNHAGTAFAGQVSQWAMRRSSIGRSLKWSPAAKTCCGPRSSSRASSARAVPLLKPAWLKRA